jgi:hypothetical protein
VIRPSQSGPTALTNSIGCGVPHVPLSGRPAHGPANARKFDGVLYPLIRAAAAGTGNPSTPASSTSRSRITSRSTPSISRSAFSITSGGSALRVTTPVRAASDPAARTLSTGGGRYARAARGVTRDWAGDENRAAYGASSAPDPNAIHPPTPAAWGTRAYGLPTWTGRRTVTTASGAKSPAAFAVGAAWIVTVTRASVTATAETNAKSPSVSGHRRLRSAMTLVRSRLPSSATRDAASSTG